jgi:hypothetical protein
MLRFHLNSDVQYDHRSPPRLDRSSPMTVLDTIPPDRGQNAIKKIRAPMAKRIDWRCSRRISSKSEEIASITRESSLRISREVGPTQIFWVHASS